jgi:hypothetical protein
VWRQAPVAQSSMQPYRTPLEPPKVPASAKAAAVAAAHAVLVQAYPGKRERLDEIYAVSLASISVKRGSSGCYPSLSVIVATVTCGQSTPLKIRMTSCEYCSCKYVECSQ